MKFEVTKRTVTTNRFRVEAFNAEAAAQSQESEFESHETETTVSVYPIEEREPPSEDDYDESLLKKRMP